MKFWKLILKEVSILKIIWELEFLKLNLKEIGILEIKLEEIRILKIIWKFEFWKLNLRIGVLEIRVKFVRNWNFEN